MTSQLIGTFSETPRRRERPRARSRRKYIHIRAFIEQATGPGDLLGQVNGPRNRGGCLGASHRPWELPRHKSPGPETAGAASPQVSGLGTASAQVTGPGDRGSCLATSLRPGNCLGTSQRPGKCLGIVHRPWELPPHKSPAWELPRHSSPVLGTASNQVTGPGFAQRRGPGDFCCVRGLHARRGQARARQVSGRPRSRRPGQALSSAVSMQLMGRTEQPGRSKGRLRSSKPVPQHTCGHDDVLWRREDTDLKPLGIPVPSPLSCGDVKAI